MGREKTALNKQLTRQRRSCLWTPDFVNSNILTCVTASKHF